MKLFYLTAPPKNNERCVGASERTVSKVTWEQQYAIFTCNPCSALSYQPNFKCVERVLLKCCVLRRWSCWWIWPELQNQPKPVYNYLWRTESVVGLLFSVCACVFWNVTWEKKYLKKNEVREQWSLVSTEKRTPSSFLVTLQLLTKSKVS